MLIKIAWRNIWRNRGRSLISIAAVFFCVFFAIVLRSMQIGSYANIIDDMVGDFYGYVQVHQNGFWDEQILDNSMEDDQELTRNIVEIPGVERVVKRMESYSLISSGKTTRVVAVMGVEPENELSGLGLQDRIIAGRIFNEGSSEIVVGEGVAEYFRMDVGDTLILIGQGYHGQSANGLFRISGIVKMRNPEINKNISFMSLPTAQHLFGAEGRLTSLTIEPRQGFDYIAINQSIKENLDEQYESMTYEEMMPELIQALKADDVGGLVMLYVLYMIIAFVLLGTVIMMTAERMKEFGILISIGMYKSKLILATVLESAFLALLGGVLGLLLARPIQWYYHENPILLTGAMEETMLEYGYEPIMPFATDWSISITHTSIIIILAILVSVYAVIKVATLQPVEAMRDN